MLNVPINHENNQANADIIAYGGKRSTLQLLYPDLGVGYSEAGGAYPPSHVIAGTLTIAGTTRQVRAYNTNTQKAEMYVIDEYPSYGQKEINEILNTTMHELGHNLGYHGHSPNVTANNQDIMWEKVHEHTTIKQLENRHLHQIYRHYYSFY